MLLTQQVQKSSTSASTSHLLGMALVKHRFFFFSNDQLHCIQASQNLNLSRLHPQWIYPTLPTQLTSQSPPYASSICPGASSVDHAPPTCNSICATHGTMCRLFHLSPGALGTLSRCTPTTKLTRLALAQQPRASSLPPFPLWPDHM